MKARPSRHVPGNIHKLSPPARAGEHRGNGGRSAGAIFVSQTEGEGDAAGSIPPTLRSGTQSLTFN